MGERKLRCRCVNRYDNRCQNEVAGDSDWCPRHLLEAALAARELIGEEQLRLLAEGRLAVQA